MNKNNPPDFIIKLAEGCIEFVKQKYKIEMDYTSETLSILDHYSLEIHNELKKIPSSKQPYFLSLIVPMIGAYWGEVVRRNFDCRWIATSEYKPEDWRIEFEYCFIYFNPAGMALETVMQEDIPGWNAHFEISPKYRPILEKRLSKLPQVTVEDYYRFTVRYDVLQTIVEHLILSNKKPPEKIITTSEYEEYIKMKEKIEKESKNREKTL